MAKLFVYYLKIKPQKKFKLCKQLGQEQFFATGGSPNEHRCTPEKRRYKHTAYRKFDSPENQNIN